MKVIIASLIIGTIILIGLYRTIDVWREIEMEKINLEQQRINVDKNRLILEACQSRGGSYQLGVLNCK